MSMESPTPLSIAQAWQAAANAQDAQRLVELSAPDIEVIGPRGSGFGHHLLREWLARAGLSLTTQRAFARGQAVALEQVGVWRDLATGAVTGEKTLASTFRANDQQQVASFGRYDNLAEALAAAGLNEGDEVE
jgi:hypothetical protein